LIVPKAFAKALIINDAGEVLCLRRSANDADRAGGWDFPGGTLEPDEGFREALAREVKEETGLDLSGPFLAYSKSESRDWGLGIWLYYVQFVVGRPAVTLSFEHDHYEWLTADAFLALTDYPKHHDIITFLRDNSLFAPDSVHRAVTTGRAIVRNNEGKILILRRSPTDPFHAGAWDLPGGQGELGEDIHETAARETREEAGIILSDLRVVFAVSRKRSEGSGTWVFFAGSAPEPEIMLSAEHDDYQWIAPEELPHYTNYDVLLDMSTFVTKHHLLEV
jgi:8-oxo-dGTP diphosphatase